MFGGVLFLKTQTIAHLDQPLVITAPVVLLPPLLLLLLLLRRLPPPAKQRAAAGLLIVMPIEMLLGGVGARSGPREPAAEGARGAVVICEDEAEGAGLMI